MQAKIVNFPNFKESNVFRGNTVRIPVYVSPVWAGYPTDDDDSPDQFSEYLNIPAEFIKRPNHTFAHRVKGDSMEPLLFEGDKLLVDCSDAAKYGSVINKIVLVWMDNGYCVKRLKIENNTLFIISENPKYPPREITKEMNFKVKGLVIGVIELRQIE